LGAAIPLLPNATTIAENAQRLSGGIGAVVHALVMANGSAVFMTGASIRAGGEYHCEHRSARAPLVVHGSGSPRATQAKKVENAMWVCPIDLGLQSRKCTSLRISRGDTPLGEVSVCDDGLPRTRAWDVVQCTCTYLTGNKPHAQSLLHHMPYWLEYHLAHGVDHFLVYAAPPVGADRDAAYSRLIVALLEPCDQRESNTRSSLPTRTAR
jgi:hypothetical protein